MRHFLCAADAVGVLAGRMPAGAAPRPLIARPGPPQRLAAANRRAGADAVELPVIASPADPHLPVAARTGEEPVAVPDRHGPATRGLDRSARSGHAPASWCGVLRSLIAMTDEARADSHPPGLRLSTASGAVLHRTLPQCQLGKDQIRTDQDSTKESEARTRYSTNLRGSTAPSTPGCLRACSAFFPPRCAARSHR